MKSFTFFFRSLTLMMVLLLINKNQAQVKNVIIMISDGWGYNQMIATDYWNGTIPGYELWNEIYPVSTFMWNGSYDPSQAWSNFNYVLQGFTDSGAAATAISTGVKTREDVIGMDPNYQPLEHLLERAESLGMATGVITSVVWSHATPAGFVAHNVHRNNFIQIAQEMVNSSAVDVIMGAGHPLFNNDGNSTTSIYYTYVGGQTTWNALVAGTAGGDANGDGTPDPWSLIQTREEFQNLSSGIAPDRVLGTAQVRETLQQLRAGGPPPNNPQPPYTIPFNTNVPTLEEMTLAGLNILDNDPDGLFLMIEGGAIDWANHDNQLGRMIEEQNDFNNAFNAVVEWVDANSNWDETLVIVTADHECGYLWGPGSGLPANFNPIGNNGTGNIPDFEYFAITHTNSLVPLFAKGIGSNQFVNYATNTDSVRGNYIDNINIADVVFNLYDQLMEIPPDEQSFIPDQFLLYQNFPNPFNPSTTIRFSLPKACNVKLILYDILGQEIKKLVNEFKEAGVHTVNLNASELNSGLYFYKLEAGSFTQTRKMTLIK